MARDYARLLCSLWNNTDFRNRSRAGQHLYMLVLSQSTMSHAGVVPLTARRWASATDGVTVADIHDALDEMDRTRFLVVDEDTEEVMVRSYLRNDLVLTNPNLAVAAVRAYEQIGSPKLRAAWVAELARLDVERRTAANPPKAWTDPRSAPLLAKVLADPLPEVPPPSHEPPSVEPPTERGSERGSVTPPPEGGVPTRTRASRAAPAPTPAPSTHSVEGRETAAPAKANELLGEWLDHCTKRPPKNVIGQAAKQIKALIGEGIDPADIRRGLAAWHTKGQHPSTLPSFVNAAMNTRPALQVVNGTRPTTQTTYTEEDYRAGW